MPVSVARPARRRPVFHRLPVAALDRLTDDAVAITFAVPESLRETYAFQAGQHLTVRVRDEAGVEARRSYSVCSTPAELASHGRIRIGVKEIPGGVFTRFVVAGLAAGEEVEVMPPLGRFITELAPVRTRWYAGIVAGSGITPLLSLAAAALAVEPESRFTLFYGNRSVRSVMFAEELSDLKDRWPDRLQVVHLFSREPGLAELLSGRIDAGRLPRLLDAFLPFPVDEWFLCGPYRMVLEARAVLADRQVPERTVHAELFHVPAEASGSGPPAAGAVAAPVAGAGCEVTFRLDGRESSVTMDHRERVLDAALRVRAELPFACRGGVCATCRARVVEGEVVMASNWALEPAELAAGYVLTCQASPVSDRLTIDYDG